MQKKHSYLPALLPLYLFTLVFVLGPILFMLAMSFFKNGGESGYTPSFTFANYLKLKDPVYYKTFTKSLQIALSTTIITALIGYPFGLWMPRLSDKNRKLMLMLLALPFGINSLIRLYGWIIILQTRGVLNGLLLSLHLIKEPLKLLYSEGAVLVGMVYALLPFMILSIYQSAERLDLSLLDASRDLGASAFMSFLTVELPLTLPGLFAGIVLTFIPSMGLFFISDILGGNKIVLVGNLIQDQMTRGGNWPFAAAIAVVLTIVTSILLLAQNLIAKAGGNE
jgi:ABC-type spermidine/putrescine transport system, permease component I